MDAKAADKWALLAAYAGQQKIRTQADAERFVGEHLATPKAAQAEHPAGADRPAAAAAAPAAPPRRPPVPEVPRIRREDCAVAHLNENNQSQLHATCRKVADMQEACARYGLSGSTCTVFELGSGGGK